MRAWAVIVCVGLGAASAAAQEPRGEIRLAGDPALFPDGKRLVFAWRGDLWVAPVEGGAARPLTQHAGRESEPRVSPDGREIAFVSDRDGLGRQVYVMPTEGGAPVLLTAHSEGHTLEGWWPDGQGLLVTARRDHAWRDADRPFRIGRQPGGGEALLFDAAATQSALAPDGRRLLFVREGVEWWRKGYTGSRAAQIWLADLATGALRKAAEDPRGCAWPLWRPDGRAFYYVGAQGGAANLRVRDLESGADRQVTFFEDDGVVDPAISADGRTIVFRRLFDLYRVDPEKGDPPVRLALHHVGDTVRPPTERRTLTTATDVAFTADGLEVAFCAGGDVWVMDTELREPRQVTATPEEEREPVFAPDGSALYFVSDRGGQADVWKATREGDRDWWRTRAFPAARLTDDAEVEGDVRPSPDGKRLAFRRGRGDLWLAAPDGTGATRLLASWDAPDYDWSPDSRWIAYAVDDTDYNRDVWIVPADGSAAPVNISRHPDNESGPVWSPDGKVLAFTGRRVEDEVDVFYVYLRQADHDETARERTLQKAVEKIEKARKAEKPPEKAKAAASEAPAAPPVPPAAPPAEADKDRAKEPDKAKEPEKAKGEKKAVEVVIDFDRIHERVRRIAIPNSAERDLFWSHDGKKLAFTATVDGKEGTYTVDVPDDLAPKLLVQATGTKARWLARENQVVWLSGGVPGNVVGGKATPWKPTAWQTVDRAARYRAGFDQAWRTMRDHYYDGRLGNRNWDAVRRKYADAAAGAEDELQFATVVSLMLGELNGSHLGFMPERAEPVVGWRPETAHLGLRFDPAWKGPGLRVRDVLPTGPADRPQSRVAPDEVLLRIDGADVDPGKDLARVLNGPLERDVRCVVRGADGKEREVVLRPIAYGAARGLLYEAWVRASRARVAKASEGRLGYVHIAGMSWPSFHRFEQELYAEGAGKDGLVIDVRENGGGFTADHLLTVLAQPEHAITVGRGGGPGYPQDRRVYATWGKPIVVLCNQNSFSNAEIFAHAVKTLRRGKVVGVRTAGGVISTGATRIMDLGMLRLPGRGWFVLGDGADMELNGAVPDVELWPDPLDASRGEDRQLGKAIEILLADVAAWQGRPKPVLRYASER